MLSNRYVTYWERLRNLFPFHQRFPGYFRPRGIDVSFLSWEKKFRCSVLWLSLSTRNGELFCNEIRRGAKCRAQICNRECARWLFTSVDARPRCCRRDSRFYPRAIRRGQGFSGTYNVFRYGQRRLHRRPSRIRGSNRYFFAKHNYGTLSWIAACRLIKVFYFVRYIFFCRDRRGMHF